MLHFHSFISILISHFYWKSLLKGKFSFSDGRRTYPQQLQSVTVYIESKEDCRSYWNIRNQYH